MVDRTLGSEAPVAVHTNANAIHKLRRRYAAERRFKVFGMAAVGLGLAMLVVLIGTIVSTGYTAFVQSHVALSIPLPAEEIDPDATGDPEVIGRASFRSVVLDAWYAQFPEVDDTSEQRQLRDLLSGAAQYIVRDHVAANPELVGTTITMELPLSSNADQLLKGNIDRQLPEDRRPMSDQQIAWLDELDARGVLSMPFNTYLFTNADSRDPEVAGMWGAIKGSFFTLLVCLALSFPIAIGAAIYLEEFAPKNRLTDLVEVNINNLAAVPSIVFGLLGLAAFINFFGLPRSAPLVGGMVLALMTLPTIIIAGRASLKAVPPSVREAALGMGASRLQAIFHHVLPLAMPGILTGTIIGLAQALGETAPLLMIGMNAFITQAPADIVSPSTAMPAQIYLWADSVERGFVERTSAAILILLGFLISMNALAIYLRKRFERRW